MDASLYVARMLYPVHVLGPGERVGIWLSGCEKRCDGCLSPELSVQREDQRTTVKQLLSLIKMIGEKRKIDGFTISGGEPMLQYDALYPLLTALRSFSKDILVFTGYAYEALSHLDLSPIGVLIDGEYRREKNMGSILRGSDNQRILFLDPTLEDVYKPYLTMEKNRMESFPCDDGLLFVGIPDKNGFLPR